MESKNYKNIILKGSKLIEMGKLFDDRQKEIDPDIDYDVRIYRYTNYMSILSSEDREVITFEDYINRIKQHGGYIDFAISYKTLGIVDSVSEFFTEAESVIKFFGEREDFNKAIYLRDEFKSLKEYYKNNELRNKK
jgi:hypothetical protein